MVLNIEQTIVDYLNKFGLLFENNTLSANPNIENKIKETRKKYKRKRKQLLKHKESALEKLKEFAKSLGEDLADEMIEKLEKQKLRIRSVYLIRKSSLWKKELEEIQRLKSISKKSGLVISGIGLASLLIYSSYKVYTDNKKRYQSLCLNKTGKEKYDCIKKYKVISLRKRYQFLNNAAIKCNYSKHPVKCKDKLDEEMLKIKLKIEDIISSSKIGRMVH
jgi:hypothetical protein